MLQDGKDIKECISDICIKVWHSVESYSPEKGKFTI
ncbi:sigma factor [Clostridium aceticum]